MRPQHFALYDVGNGGFSGGFGGGGGGSGGGIGSGRCSGIRSPRMILSS